MYYRFRQNRLLLLTAQSTVIAIQQLCNAEASSQRDTNHDLRLSVAHIAPSGPKPGSVFGAALREESFCRLLGGVHRVRARQLLSVRHHAWVSFIAGNSLRNSLQGNKHGTSAEGGVHASSGLCSKHHQKLSEAPR